MEGRTLNKRHVTISRGIGAAKAHFIASKLKGDDRGSYQYRITFETMETTTKTLVTDQAWDEIDRAARDYMAAVLKAEGFTERTGSWTHPNLPGASV